ASRPRSLSVTTTMPEFGTSAMLECPVPAARRRNPPARAYRMASETSSSEAASTTTALHDRFPNQLVHVSLAIFPWKFMRSLFFGHGRPPAGGRSSEQVLIGALLLTR